MAEGIQQRKRAFWREVVQGWAASGLSKAAYAREHGIPAHQLGQWVARYPEWVSGDQESVTTASRAAAAPRFITVHAPQADSTDPEPDEAAGDATPLVLALPGSRRLEIRPGFCPDTLRRVLEALAP